MFIRTARSHLAHGAKNAVILDSFDAAVFEIEVIKGYARTNECIGNDPEKGEGIVMGLTCYSPKSQQFVSMDDFETEMNRIQKQAKMGWKDYKPQRRSRSKGRR